jgi:hypothetical protein
MPSWPETILKPWSNNVSTIRPPMSPLKSSMFSSEKRVRLAGCGKICTGRLSFLGYRRFQRGDRLGQ